MSESSQIAQSERHFQECFGGSSHGSTGECSCGAFCFDSNDQWDEDHAEQFERWNKQQAENPTTCVGIDGAVQKIEFGGRGFVIGCQCEQDKKIKQALDFSAEELAKYLNLESTRLSNKAGNMSVKIK